MDKKRFVLSITQLFLSLAAFIVVSFAWFVVSDKTRSEPIQFLSSHEFVNEFEIRFFTNQHIYKYMPDEQEIYIYDSGTYVHPSSYCEGSICETPSYGYQDKNYLFEGIFIDQYDPLIPENNTNNYIFMELYMTYNVTENTTLNISAMQDTSLAAGSMFGTPEYYLSEVVYMQYMESYDYTASLESENIFEDLKLDFSEVSTYPLYSFYDATDIYLSSFDFDGTITLTPATTELYLYFAYSYYEEKIDLIILNEGPLPIAGYNYIRFFQDVIIILKGGA